VAQEQERATGRDVILAIAENMRVSLEPLVTKTLAPSLYQVYLHRDDHDHLRTIFPELEAEAKRLLDGELDRLNRSSVPPLDRLLTPLLRKGKEKDEAAGGPRYVSAEGRWTIRFQEDPNGTLEPGDVEVVSEFAQDPGRSYGAGSKTHRISTTRRLGGATAIHRETVEATASAAPGVTAEALARFSYRDDGGQRTFLMTKDEIVIGREAADVWVDLRLETLPDVSREHFRLRRDPATGRFFLKDLSRLGTSINGERAPSSIEFVDGEKRDRNMETAVPDQAKIGLADVVFIEFRSATNG
jgi:hypothetical protein